MKDLKQYEIDDPNFVDDLVKSQSHVQKVAAWLKATKGLNAVVQPTRIRANVEQMSAYSDDGDVFIENDPTRRVEVKNRKLRFTCREDFPYPTIIVDVAHVWDRAEHKPKGYILTNQDCTSVAIVDGNTFVQWEKTNKWDRVKKRYRTFYECPLKFVRFERFE